MKKERKSNIELLRIVAMLCIISFHYVYKSGYVFENLSVNSFIVKVFWFFGEFGVNLFILITGYFMVNGRFSLKKLICLLLEVEFYYLISMFIATKLDVIQMEKSFRNYFLLFFPTILNKYWFITVYVLVYIISPYLNILIHNMEQRTYKKFLIIILMLWSVIPTIFGIFYNSTETLLYYSRFIWFIIMYFVGAYIRLYSIKILDKPKNAMIGASISFVVMIVSIFVIDKFLDLFKAVGTKEVAYFWPPNTIPMFMISVSIFELFLKIDIGSIKIINRLASTTLGIYMIHDGVLNPYIWKTIFKAKEHLQSNYSILYIFASAIIIFLIGAMIDWIRQWIEKNTINKILNSKTSEKISNKLSKLGTKIIDRI